MKALILSISAGRGHYETGEAISNVLDTMGVECMIIDAYEYIDPKLSKLVSKGYLLSAQHIPKLSSYLYNILVKKNTPFRTLSVPHMANTVLAWDLKKYIEETRPDVIICTHVLSAILVNVMKTRGWTSALAVGIITDFTVHPLWEETRNIDYYVTPSELLEFQMQRKGLDVNKILPFGIPIKPRFSKKIDRKKAREMLGLETQKPTILLMSGSMGYGKIDESIEMLDHLSFDFQTMVVCGNNNNMYKRIKRKSLQKRFDIYGYTNQVDLMMDAADCIITKPGGLTSSEALAKGLPMIMINPIPGQEMRNAEFMLNNGIALYATKSFPLDEAIFSLFKHPDRIQNLQATIALYAKKNASKTLCKFLVEQIPSKALK